MTTWTLATLRALDLKYAKDGVHLHQRPFRAAREILGSEFSMGFGGNPQVEEIIAAYHAMIPEARASWPGMGIGLAAVVDQARKIVMPVSFGDCVLTPSRVLDFPDEQSWWQWCREDERIAAASHFAVADLHDLTYGLDDLRGNFGDEGDLWEMATSNLADAANNLPTAFSVDSVLQPICMVVELSLKAALVRNGADINSFKGPEGHKLVKLADRLARELPHRDDASVHDVVDHLPPYVGSRYKPAGLTRLDVVHLALGAQFVAASSVRRFSSRDLAAEMEAGEWPAPRPPFFDA